MYRKLNNSNDLVESVLKVQNVFSKKPSSLYEIFENNDFKLTYPGNWSVIYGNELDDLKKIILSKRNKQLQELKSNHEMDNEELEFENLSEDAEQELLKNTLARFTVKNDENISISIQAENIDASMSFEEWANEFQKQVNELNKIISYYNKNLNTASFEKIKTPNCEAYQLKTFFTDNNVRDLKTYFVNNNKLYTISYSASINSDKLYFKSVQKMIDSFKFNN